MQCLDTLFEQVPHPWTLEELAGRAGYTDEFAFSVAFKRHFGLSPSKLRKG